LPPELRFVTEPLDHFAQHLTRIRRHLAIYSWPSQGEPIKRLHGENCAESFGILEAAILAVVKQKLQSFSQNLWSDVAMEFAKHKNGKHSHF
jgi:hypothetical protein